MPRAPAFKISALADLHRQLQYAPPETRKRQLDAAERLINEIDPDIAYPSAFVIYRVTGYRPDDVDMMTFAGAALRTDLANLIQRISDTLDLPSEREGHLALRQEEVARRLGVSSKTIQRYRREGLVCHVVAFGADDRQLACFEDALARFCATRGDHLKKAARFTRIGDDIEASIIETARALRAMRPLSLNAAAKIIARQHGRAHETIRLILRKHDALAAKQGEPPIFPSERVPMIERDLATLHRAWVRGIDLTVLAARYDRSRPAILRAITRRRAETLRGVRVAFIDMRTFAMDGAEEIFLSAPAATQNLLALPPHDDAIALLDWAGLSHRADEATEDALLGAWNLLKRRAALGIARLRSEEAPNSADVDAIETDLRWATRLHRRLMLLAVPAAIRRIEANHGRSAIALPADQIVALIQLAAGVIREALEGLDPSRGQRMERVVSFAMERALAQRDVSMSSVRAAARYGPGTKIDLRGVFDAIDEWESWLDPWRGMRDCVAALPKPSRDIMAMRYGWDGGPPRTMLALVQHLKRNAPVIARQLQKATRELRAAARDARQ